MKGKPETDMSRSNSFWVSVSLLLLEEEIA